MIKDLKTTGKGQTTRKGLYKGIRGYKEQLGNDHVNTKKCAMNLAIGLAEAGEKLKLRKIIDEYPHILIEDPSFKNNL